MTDCGCADKNEKSISILQNDDMECQTIVNETVCVQGTVTITPDVKSGPSRSFCVGRPTIGSCPGELSSSCQFTVS